MSGDFEQWSREAAAKCSVFLLVYTAHTENSQYVPIEVGVFKEQDDWENRLVPVVLDRAFMGCENLRSVTLSRRFEGDIVRIFGNLDNSIFHFV